VEKHLLNNADLLHVECIRYYFMDDLQKQLTLVVIQWDQCDAPAKRVTKNMQNEFLTIFKIFILAAILKILKTKSTILSDDLFLCQVSKGSAVRSEFNIFCTLVTMATAVILNFCQPLKGCHTIRWIFLQSFMKFDERNPNIF
jgi:hypothetical protein